MHFPTTRAILGGSSSLFTSTSQNFQRIRLTLWLNPSLTKCLGSGIRRIRSTIPIGRHFEETPNMSKHFSSLLPTLLHSGEEGLGMPQTSDSTLFRADCKAGFFCFTTIIRQESKVILKYF
jgi:hypothetical protein